jgi:hypothetical protein
VSAWLKRFGLHLAAAVGATGIFVAAAAVGASQTRQQVPIVAGPSAAIPTHTPRAQRQPSVVVGATPVPTSTPGPVSASEPTPGPTSGPTSGPASPLARPTRSPDEPQPGPLAAQPGPIEVQPEPDQPQPGAQLLPPVAPKPGAANPPSPRPSPRTTPTARTSPSPTAASPPASPKVVPERSLAGTIKAVLPDGLDVLGVGGREWFVAPAPGALIRLNGKTARLDGLQAGDTVVILGQAQSGAPANRFVAHAITARRK